MPALPRFRPSSRALSWLPALLALASGACAEPQATAPDARAAAATSATPIGTAAVSVTFRVTVPAETPPDDFVHIAGNFQGWDPGSAAHRLALGGDGKWSITLAFEPGQNLEFKFTRGTWAKVEKGPNGEEIANRLLTVPAGGGTFDYTVARWADISGPPTIVGDVTTWTYAPFLNGRRIWVYRPPGYATSSDRYPVLYMHDGQNLFDRNTSFAGEWKVDETLEQLIPAGEIPAIIVVGIDNGGASRTTEYTPWVDPSRGGGGGDAYLQALRDVLKPEIDRRYRTLTGPRHTWMAGSSLGGLISAYAGQFYADTWGRIGAVSPSYWWAGSQMISFTAIRPRPERLERFYQDMGSLERGTLTDTDGDGIDDYIELLRDMRSALFGQGFLLELDLKHVEAMGHVHNETYWAMRLPDMLRFLAGTPQTLGVPGSR
jgi:pullulanase